MKVVWAEREDVLRISEVVASLGLPVADVTIRRFFFESPCIGWTPEHRGGLVVRNDNDEIVGFCGLSPCDITHAGRFYPGYQMGVIGILPGYGGAMFDVMDMVVDLTSNALVYANTANLKSGKLWTEYAGFSFGPPLCSLYQYAITLPGAVTWPLSLRTCRESNLVPPEDLDERTSLSSGEVETFRFADRFNWLYGGGTGARRFFVFSDGGRARGSGWAVVCAKRLRRLPLYRYEIMDIYSSRGNDYDYTHLLDKIKSFSSLHGGIMVEYIGARKLLPHKRAVESNPFIWKTEIEPLRTALLQNPISFFGPYDGDRSLG